ncbi:hypothetical protein HH214_17505 [Mucilaginibacter robiniae]|uniref:Beta-1,6-galactofuranosyltransferase n=1 Tax=Mucilaginibacter robiniae TaxID=2728022 RepID=A0A7L5E2D7_9SPHI|nr:hypothetical protein [Mucilaginibacter robiniae]QJD97540.1 hypothetical protein HH214_17505 [Mucilaginibacter robiniae]
MNRYQFYISFDVKETAYTAGTKAIQDCNAILKGLDYRDYNIHNAVLTNKGYLYSLFKNVFKLLLFVKPSSIVAIQYPLLSGNSYFKHIIKILRLKKVKFFCIIHDVEGIRYHKDNVKLVKAEVQNLNFYDGIIVHNTSMQQWLSEKGVIKPMLALQIFDYLSDQELIPSEHLFNQKSITIVFAGNLTKSTFIYSLQAVNKQFNLYGPNFLTEKGCTNQNISWKGAYSPNDIISKLDGDFGLIWDGEFIDKLDDVYGSYLMYNNPHKLSLYIAAGLPVIAPKNSAIGQFIQKHQLGILIDSLVELNNIQVTGMQYQMFKRNISLISPQLRSGTYLKSAIAAIEEIITHAS